MRSNDLRSAIVGALNTLTGYDIEGIYYGNADENALYPHIVFQMTGTNLSDLHRKDYTVDVNVWSKSEAEAENIADDIEDLFVYRNDPKADILPTFYLVTRLNAEDPDKDIKHIVIRLESQMYDNE